MATVQVNGSNLTNNGYGSFNEANNDNGTIKANGQSSALDSLTTPTAQVGVFGSVVVEDSVTDADYAAKAVSGGEFAHSHNKPISALITTELAGLDSNAITSPAVYPGLIRSINSVQSVRTRRLTTAIRNNKFNEFSGEFDAGFPVVALDTFSEDTAASVNGRSVTGQLVYRTGAKDPVSDNYKSKTN